MRKLQHLLYIMIVLIAVATMPTQTLANKSFTDVSSKDQFEEHVNFISKKGIIHGYDDGSFRPRNNITRAQAAKMLIEATNNQNISIGNLVITGPKGEQYDYLSKAVYLGYFKTTGSKNYINPNEVINRDEIGYALAKAFNVSASPTSKPLMLTDINKHPYVNELNGLYYAGITEGDNFTYMPSKKLSRAHFSMFLARAMSDNFKLEVKHPEQVADNLFVKVKTGSATLNLREEPNASSTSKVLTSIPNGTVLEVLAISNNWYKVEYNNKTGFISSSFTENALPPEVSKPEPTPEPKPDPVLFKVTIDTRSSSTLNIRTQPNASSSSTIIGTYTNGTVVDVIGTTNGWYKVNYKNSIGYISSSFAVKEGQTPTPPVNKPSGGNLIGKVTAPSLNVRTGPNLTSSIIGSAKLGQTLEVTALNGNWATVKIGGKTGYVSKIYLKLMNQTANPLKDRIIVIDAGHGGHDPGTSKDGLTERSITLNVAKRVEAKLKSAGAKPLMTRSTDVYLSLPQRTDFAKSNFAESFVSIHVNSATPAALGTETFYDSKGNVNGAESKVLASAVQKHLVKDAQMVNRGIKDYGFYVVRNNNAPAILVELGFITNASDNSKLTSNTYLDRYAEAIYKGLVEYYSN